MNNLFLCKLMLALLLLAGTSQKIQANEIFDGTSDSTPIQVEDFSYFFYKSYNVHNGTLTNVCTVAAYLGEEEEVVIPRSVAYGSVDFQVAGIDWRLRESGNLKNIKKLTIPNTVIEIEQGAFNDVDQQTHLTFEDGPELLYCHDCGNTHSQYGAFTYMDGLQEVYVGRELAWNYEEYDQAPFYRNNDGSYFNVTIGPKVGTVHYHTFDHAHVKGVNFLEAETAINVEEDAFNDTKIETWLQYRQVESPDQPCKGSSDLHVIRIGGTVKSIKDGEFQNCYNVWEVNLKDASKLETIGEYAFEDCDDAPEVFIPKSVTKIGYEAFYDMDNLKKLTFEDSETPLDMTGGFVFYGYNGYSKELQEIYLGRTLNLKEGKENYEFADRNNITTITIGPKCEIIHNKMFQNCKSVHSIDMSRATGLKRIGQHAFEDCDEVTSLTIPGNVTWIGYEAFYDIDKLVSITIEDSPEALDMWEGAQFRAYDNANAALKSVYVGRNLIVEVDGSQKDNFYNRKITSVGFGRYVTDIPDRLFYNNPFATITFAPGMGPLRIGKEALVGDGNTTVSSIIIQTPISYIGEEAFYDNTSLVTLSLNMAKDALIEKNAFENCEMISTVIIDLDGTMSSSQGSDCFEADIYGKAMLRVNTADAEAAATQEPWKNFTRRDASYGKQLSFEYDGQTYNLTQGEDGIFRYQNSLGELQTFVLNDAVAINSPIDFEANVSYNRTITKSSDKWAETLYLPFSMEKPAGIKLYTLSPVQVDKTGAINLTLEEADTIEAFKPYIVMTTEDTFTFPTAKRTIKAGNEEVTIEADKFFTITGTITGKTSNQKQLVPAAEEMKFSAVEEPVLPYRAMLQTSRDETEFEGVVVVEINIKNDATDNTIALEAADRKVANITLQGTTFHKDGNWHSIYLPFDLKTLEGTPLEGAEIRKLYKASYEEDILSLYYEKNTGTLYHSYPYIFRFEEGGEDIDNPTFKYMEVYLEGKELPRDFGAVKIYGTYDAVDLLSSDRWSLYLDEESTYCNPDKNVKVDACTAYIKMRDEIGAYAGTKSALQTEGDIIRFDLGITDADGIESIKDDLKSQKDEWYDMSGRRIGAKPTTKGVYVTSGRKVIIK